MDVQDVAALVVRAVEDDSLRGERLEIGGPEPLKPQLGRQARAALAMDVLPLGDDSTTRDRFPDLPRRRVSEIISDLPVPIT